MPARTCLVCRQTGEQESLWRISVLKLEAAGESEGCSEIRVVPDVVALRQGRGLYFHFPGCFTNKAFLKCLNGALSALYKKWEERGVKLKEKIFITSQSEFLNAAVKAAEDAEGVGEKSEKLMLLQKVVSEHSPKFRQVLTPIRRH